MSQNDSLHTDAPAQKIETVRADEEMRQSYIDYAMSVIAGRSLPDARDGLKPVHRRILYAMHESGVTSNTGHRKSSSIIGDTMGDYHPHGDSSIYDALARMAQDFSLRHPLVDGQGNFGSIDDDPPAAMRYTEARLSPIGEEMLADIERNTVDFSSNYDDRLEEPDVLPSAFPNLLVNGSSGIAVGLSTNIPPHNLGEVIDATIHLIDNPDAETQDLMEHMPGPDFPTGAKIAGREGIYDAYETGKGRLTVRAEYHVEEHDRRNDEIIITEIPYQANKSRLVERIANLANEGDLGSISDLRDESDRNGIRIVVEVERGSVTDVVENRLVNQVLEKTFSIQMLALVDGKPEVLTLKDALRHYVDHRKEVVRRRSQNELEEKEDRAHILEGRLKALEHAEKIVELIRESDDRTSAIEALQDEYDFSEVQAKHIVRMQLGSLTSLEATEIEEEYESVTDRIDRLNEILESEQELLDVVKDELRDVKAEYADERRTQIVDAIGDVTREDLIPEKEIAIAVTNRGYIKRMVADDFSSQHRAGKGVIGIDLDNDYVTLVERVSTHDKLYFFTTTGDVYEAKGYELPEFGRNARGTAAVNVFDLDDEEQLTSVTTVPEDEEREGKELAILTRHGKVKRTPLNKFENIFSTGIRAVGLEDSDEVVDAAVVTGDEEIIVGTSDGRAIRFPVEDVTSTGRSAQGVNAVELDGTDVVTGFAIVEGNEDLLTLTENGYGKRTSVSEYTTQSRYGKGLADINTGDRNGDAKGVYAVEDGDELFAMSADGQAIRTSINEIQQVGRNTKGVIVMRFDEDDEFGDAAVR